MSGKTQRGRSDAVSAADGLTPGPTDDLVSKPLTDAEKRRRMREGRIANAPARKAATQARRATIAARTGPTGYRIGTWVRTDTPRSPRFHNRSGIVVTNNLGEVGVNFGTDWAIRIPNDVDAWFLPSELRKEAR